MTALQLPFPEPASHTKRFSKSSLSLDDLGLSEVVVKAKEASEFRGNLDLWNELYKSSPDRVVLISEIDKEYVEIERCGRLTCTVALRDEKSLCEALSSDEVLIDISGLPHHIWAPLLKAMYSNQINTRVLYAEPDSYKLHPTPASATLFDLSVSFGGLAPLPGFVQLSSPPDDSRCLFVALLGFEGNRPMRLALQIDPPPKIIPIVGVPGFQLEFPAFTIACNRDFLDEFSAHSDIRYARASCPFEVYRLLKDIQKDYPGYYVYLAPVGTKPHSLGAIWYSIAHPASTEIVFDHPVRKSGRTSGVGVIHIFNLGNFDAG